MAKVLRVLFLLVVLALLFIPTLVAMKQVAIAQIYSSFTDHLASLIGSNMYLIRVVVVLAMVPFFYALKLYFSFDGKRRRIGSALMTAFVVFYNLGLYFSTKDQYFTFQEGKVTKWYAITPDGVKFHDRPGVEPVYGIPLKPVSPEVIRNLKTLERGDFRSVDPSQVTWFNPISGDAQLWFFLGPEGTFEFYNKPGYHPFTNAPLKPVTKDVYYQWKARTARTAEMTRTVESGIGSKAGGATKSLEFTPPPLDKRQRRLNELKSMVNPTGPMGQRAVAVLLESTLSGADQALYGRLKSDRNQLLTNVFRMDVFRSGLFEDLYQGDGEMLRTAVSAAQVGWMIIGKLQHSYRKTAQIDADLFSCELTLNVKLVNHSGVVVQSDMLRSVGPGFSESAALEHAAEALAAQFQERLLKVVQ